MRSGPFAPGLFNPHSPFQQIDWRTLRKSARAARRAMVANARELSRQQKRQARAHHPLRGLVVLLIAVCVLWMVFSGPEAPRAVVAVLTHAVGLVRDVLVSVSGAVQ